MSNHLCAAGLALLAFTTSLVIGLVVNNTFVTVVQRSVVALVFFYALGFLLAVLGQKVIRENFNNQVTPQTPNPDKTPES
jgi:hypothetical protein